MVVTLVVAGAFGLWNGAGPNETESVATSVAAEVDEQDGDVSVKSDEGDLLSQDTVNDSASSSQPVLSASQTDGSSADWSAEGAVAGDSAANGNASTEPSNAPDSSDSGKDEPADNNGGSSYETPLVRM